MIETEQLRFDYAQAPALDGVCMTAPTGRITALVGPNGAGKTTLMRILAGLMRPHGGRAVVNGVDVAAEPRRIHEITGFLPDFIGLYDTLTTEQHLLHSGASTGLSSEQARARGRDLAQKLGVMDLWARKAEEMSRGQRQRLAIAQALMKQPRLLILDEPASGLDPEARQELATLLRKLKDDGATLLVSSHILSELEDYSDRVVVMRDGRVQAIEELTTTEASPARIAVTLAREISDPYGVIAAASPQTEILSIEGLAIELRAAPKADEQAALLAALVGAGLPIAAFAAKRRRLQDAYFDTSAASAPVDVAARGET